MGEIIFQIERLPRLTYRTLISFIDRQQRTAGRPACYECHDSTVPLFLHDGKLVCEPCNIINRLRHRGI